MLNSIANLKESLNKIALDVHGSDEDLRTHGGGDEDSAVFDRRNSHSFAQSKSVSRSPVGNAVESPCRSEIEQYKAEIKRLQKSEAEIKSLSVNYASLLKEREDRISRLNEENGSLKQNLNATKHRSDVLKGNGDHSNNRQHKLLKQVKNHSNGNQIQNGFVFKQDGLSNGTHAVHPDAVGGKTEKGLADLLEEKNKSLAAVRIELEKERNTSANLQHKLQDELNLNSSYEEELKSLRGDKENACAEMRIINTQLNERTSNIRRLQMELHRRNDEDAGDVVQSLKRVIAALEKENGDLKLEKDKVEAALKNSRSFPIDKVSSDVSENSTEHPSTLNEKTQSFGGSLEKELELTVQKLEKDLKGAREERDKAIQELARLKQHLLDKNSHS